MEAIGTGAAANLSSETAKGIFQVIVQQAKYVISFQKNVDKYDQKLKTLIAKRASVRQEVEAATRNAEKIKADVEGWCERVDKTIESDEAKKKVKDLKHKAHNNSCFVGLCPDIKSRYQLSKLAEEDAANFDELLQQCQFNGSVAYRDVPEAMIASSKDFETFESRQKVFNDIMDALKDGNISVIGVYGKEGAGKTTLINEVARQVLNLKLFDWFCRADVTQNPDVEKIQDQIAESLGLSLKEKSTSGRARRLFQRLKKEKKILVVLDDVWKRLDLEEVGIPHGDQHNGCKIVVMSRDENVVSNGDGMDADESFEINGLEEYEAWELFKKIAGKTVESNVELQSIAMEVAKNCRGLPGAIARIARGLRNKPVFEWKTALQQLKRQK